jgi:predicted RNase H-like nuclease
VVTISSLLDSRAIEAVRCWMAAAGYRRAMGATGRVLGVDGCRGGWIGVVLGAGHPPVGVFGPSIVELVDEVGPVDLIGIDMPIHPPHAGARPADLAARAHLGRKASSVFPTPARTVLAAATYDEACRVARAIDGRAISRQAWSLRRKILEVDGWLAAAPCPVREVHPEVSFSLLAGAPIADSKRTWAGQSARRRSLELAGIPVPPNRGPVSGVAGVGADDVLDAAVVAWSARRIAEGVARSFPDPPVRLADGTTPAIWA